MIRLRPTRSALHTALWVDVAFELMAGVALLVLASTLDTWLNVPASVVRIAGVVFVAAAVAIAIIALQPELPLNLVSGLAKLNLLGGVGIWLVLGVFWGDLTSEGRWLSSAIADSFIAIGVLEWLAVRRVQSGPTG